MGWQNRRGNFLLFIYLFIFINLGKTPLSLVYMDGFSSHSLG